MYEFTLSTTDLVRIIENSGFMKIANLFYSTAIFFPDYFFTTQASMAEN